MFRVSYLNEKNDREKCNRLNRFLGWNTNWSRLNNRIKQSYADPRSVSTMPGDLTVLSREFGDDDTSLVASDQSRKRTRWSAI